MHNTIDRIKLFDLKIGNFSLEYSDWLNDTETNCFLESKYIKHTVDSCNKYILDSNNKNNIIFKGIFLLDTDIHIGNIRLELDLNHNRATIGFLLGEKKYWGQGYMSEALNLFLNYVFNNTVINKIEAGCYESNIGSLKTMLKVGFTLEGFRRESVLYKEKREGLFQLGITKNDYNLRSYNANTNR
jgi:[ribosomal protein S5]-alanine N-acetyltransferase